jgi:dUTP pyrophosphatase
MDEKEIEIPTLASDSEFIPVYATEAAAGADVKAYIPETIILQPGCSVLVPTGLRFAIPAGYEIQVRPRSGLALKNSITILNSPGTIDADYRGEVGVILINHGRNAFEITPGMRIGQLVVARVERAAFSLVELLSSTSRGEGGFGHTGTH